MKMIPGDIDLSQTAETADQLICPFMSGQAIPVQATGAIAMPTGNGVVTMMTHCAREKCACFDPGAGVCSVNRIPGLIYALDSSTQEILGGLVGIVDKLDGLTTILDCVDSTLSTMSGHLVHLQYLHSLEKIAGHYQDISEGLVNVGAKLDPPKGKSNLGVIADGIETLVTLAKARKGE